MVCGLFGVAVNQSLFLKGLSLTTPIDASIIMVSNPILVLIASSIILKEKITGFKTFGIAFGAGGALLLILNSGQADLTGDHFKGNIFVFFNAASYGIYLVLVKPLVTKYHPVTVMKWVFLWGSVFVVPIGINQAMAVNWQLMPLPILLSVLFVVVGTTFLAFLLNIFAMKQVSPTTVSIYIYLQPVISSVTAIFLNQDELSPVKIISTLLVFAGVYLVSVPRKTLKSKIRFIKSKIVS
jgi:drug/metabolite transporter (DMT)-like permease